MRPKRPFFLHLHVAPETPRTILVSYTKTRQNSYRTPELCTHLQFCCVERCITALKSLHIIFAQLHLLAQLLGREFRFQLVPTFLDGGAGFLPDRLGLDDLITAVDLCETLAFGSTFACLDTIPHRLVNAQMGWGEGRGN